MIRFSQEQILHDQVIQCCEGLSRDDVGIRHRRIFAHDVHRPNIAGVDSSHDFDHGESAIWIEIRFPEFGTVNVCLDCRQRRSPVEHRYQPSVRCSLDVLAPKGVKSGAGAADMSVIREVKSGIANYRFRVRAGKYPCPRK